MAHELLLGGGTDVAFPRRFQEDHPCALYALQTVSVTYMDVIYDVSCLYVAVCTMICRPVFIALQHI